MYVSPRRFNKTTTFKNKLYIKSFFIFLIWILFSSCSTQEAIPTEGPNIWETEKVNFPKLKQGLDRLAWVYETKGEQAAFEYAIKSNLPIKQNLIDISIYTVGFSGSDYSAEISHLGIKEFTSSEITNVIYARVSLSQLISLAEEDFINFITPVLNISDP